MRQRPPVLDIDLLLSPIGGGDKAVEPRQIQEKTNQANAAGSDFNADHMKSNHEPVSERQSRTPLKELGDVRADIQGIFLGAHGGQVAIP
jgi:hypothetical protein